EPADPPTSPGGVATQRRQRSGFVGVGAVAGGLSGLLGIGGGVVMVPGFTQLAGMALKRAIATSLVCVGLFAIPGTVTHALQDQIDWRVALILAITVIPGSVLGAVLTLRAGEQRLRLAVGLFLVVIAVVYATGEVVALFD
ncbi:MAG: sulfite exporter TauE/SafE family protein, partial [Actinomycetota bacterium]|nr:sulfite exporter TauE/SafE family protein [Actinomycetota bacterium]